MMKRPYRISLTLLCWLSAWAVWSAAPARTSTDSVPDPDLTAIDALLSSLTDAKSPSVVLGIYAGGKTVYEGAYGLADLERDERATPRSIFNLASVSKQFMGFSMALLAREGKVDLHADVRKYLPWVPDFGTPITVEQLLYHTSGMRDYVVLGELAGLDGESLLRQQQVLNLVMHQQQLNFAPGSNFQYSNTGYCLLAEIIRAVTGQSAAQFMQARIFGPLGMTHTHLRESLDELAPGAVIGYKAGPGGKGWVRAVYNHETYGPGNILSNVQDLGKWGNNFGHSTVGDRALIEQMAAPGRLNGGAPLNYGFGVRQATLGGQRAITHQGSIRGFHTDFAYFPAPDVSIALLSNRNLDVDTVLEQIAALYFKDLPGLPGLKVPAVVRPSAKTLMELAGLYDGENWRAMVLELRDGRLIRRDVAREWGPLTFWADGTFGNDAYGGDRFRAIRSPRGDIVALDLIPTYQNFLGDVPHQRLARVNRWEAPVADLQAITGKYYSPELDRTYTLTLESGQLVLRSLWVGEPQKFVPTFADHLDAVEGPLDELDLQLRRDTIGQPTGVILNAWGVVGLNVVKLHE